MNEITRGTFRELSKQLADILYKFTRGDMPPPPTFSEGKSSLLRQVIKTWAETHTLKVPTGIPLALMFSSACLPTNDVSKMPLRQSDKAPLNVNAEVGALADPLLDQEKLTSLTLEIQPMGATQLSQEALNHVKGFLVRELTWKPGQISITVNPPITNYQDPYSESGQLSLRWAREIEKRIRKRKPTGRQGAVFLLVSDARSVDQTDTARPFGLAHRSTSVILYHPAIADASGGHGQPQRWRLEAAVIEHELGHLLGLVNTAPTRGVEDISQEEPVSAPHLHEAPDSPTHCANPDCLMHASTLGALSMATGRTADQMPELCDKCREAIAGSRENEN